MIRKAPLTLMTIDLGTFFIFFLEVDRTPTVNHLHVLDTNDQFFYSNIQSRP